MMEIATRRKLLQKALQLAVSASMAVPALSLSKVRALAIEPGDPKESLGWMASHANRLRPRSFGAHPGNSAQENSEALKQLTDYARKLGGAWIDLQGDELLVGQQTFAGRKGLGHAYAGEAALSLADLGRGVVVEGGKLKFAAGLRFGSYDPLAGTPYTPPKLPFLELDYRAYAGNLISVSGCSMIIVRDMELDGSSGDILLGGQWGDTGYQLFGSGIALTKNGQAQLEDLYIHHCPLDCVVLAWPGAAPTDAEHPVFLTNVRAEYASRNNLSWVGGVGLYADGLRTNHAGRGLFRSSPGAGIDIEAENAVCRRGVFRNGESIDNAGVGMVADSGDSADVLFQNYRFWGTSNWSIWPRKPRLTFENCEVLGPCVNAFGSEDPTQATKFIRTLFEDRAYPTRGVYEAGYVTQCGGLNVRYEDCVIRAHTLKAAYMSGLIIRRLRIEQQFAPSTSGDFVAVIGAKETEGLIVLDQMSNAPYRNYYVSLAAGGLGRIDGPVRFLGNSIHLGGPNGPQGDVASFLGRG